MADFNEMSIFDFFGGNDFEEEQKELASSEKEETVATGAKTTTVADVEDEDDDNDEVTSSDDADETKPAATTATKTTKKKAEEKIKTPIDVFGRNFTYSFIEAGEFTKSEFLKKIYDAGYVEVADNGVSIITGAASGIYLTYPSNGSSSNTLVTFTEGRNYVIADGMEQCPLTKDNFVGLNTDEISAEAMADKFAEQFAKYADCELSINNDMAVAIPVMSKAADSDIIELPVRVIKSGRETTLTSETFNGATDKTVADILAYLCATETAEGLKPYLAKASANTYFVEYGAASGKNAKAKQSYGIDKKAMVVNEAGKEKKEATAYYTLPFDVYFVTINQRIPLTAENFGGKTKVKEEAVLDYLKQNFAILRSKDRKIDVVYAKEQNVVSIALVSGTKGAGVVAEEKPQRCGFFNVYSSFEALVGPLKKSKFFLGMVKNVDTLFRVEASPVGVFMGACNNENASDLYAVRFISRLSKIPRVIYDEIVADFTAHPEVERICRIYWDDTENTYRVIYPSTFYATKGRIDYSFGIVPDDWYLVMTVHSHNTMKAYFSQTDDNDEIYTGLYGVIGNVDKPIPSNRFRVGMEGSFAELPYDMLFAA